MTVIPSYVRYIGIVTIGLLLGQAVGLSNSYTPYLIALNLGLLTTLFTTTYLFPSMLPDFSAYVEEEEEKTPNNRQAFRAKERKEAKDKKKEKDRKE